MRVGLNALAKSEKIEVSESEINSKLEEVEADMKLSKDKNVNADRLKKAITDDILQEKLFLWLEENNTIVEKVPEKKKAQSKEKSSKKKTTQSNKEKKSSKTPKS